MAQGRKVFDEDMDKVKAMARDIFQVKDYSYEEVGDTVYANSRDGKRNYRLNFAETDKGVEVTASFETKKGLRDMFKKKDPFASDDEIEALWRLFDLKRPKPEEGPLAGFVHGLLNDIENGKSEVPIPEGFQVDDIGGGMLRIKDEGTGMKREVLIPKDAGSLDVQGDRIKIT